MTTELKDVYEFIEKHDHLLANKLCTSIKRAKADLKLAVDHKQLRLEKYDTSLWQRLTLKRYDVLRQLNDTISDRRIKCRRREDDMVTIAKTIWNESIKRKEAQVDEGNLLYYVVDGRTNNRKRNDIGEPIIYATKTDAEYACVGYDEIISIAAYNRVYGRFMSE